MNKTSRLFQEISREKLEEITEYYLNCPLEDGKLLFGGLFNTTYLLRTGKGEAILRLGPVNRRLLLEYERNLMEAETDVLSLLHKHGIPTSRILAVDTRRTIVDRDVMLLQRIPARSMSLMEPDKETEERLCRETGTLVRRIHKITADELPKTSEKPYGRYGAVLAGQGGATWREALEEEVRGWQRCMGRTDLLPEENVERIAECFFSRSPVLDIPQLRPRLVHGDLWYGNILVDDRGCLTAVIDVDRALFGDPEFDLASGWMTTSAFFAGYGKKPDSDSAACLRRRLYKLLLDMEDCYVLYEEYASPQEAQRLAAQVMEDVKTLESL